MTARWRTVLRLRAVLRLLLEDHVPLGAMSRVVTLVARVSDEDLPNEQRVHGASMTGALARDILNELLGDDVELIDRDTDRRPTGEPRDLLRVHDELERRRAAAAHSAEQTFDQGQKAIVGELDEVLAFMAPLMGKPLPDVEAFEAYLDSEGFYNVMQAYRHASVVPQGEVTTAFETVKAVLKAQVRQ